MNESNRSWVTTKQGMDVAKSQIRKKKLAHGGESTSNPDMLDEIKCIGSSFVV